MTLHINPSTTTKVWSPLAHTSPQGKRHHCAVATMPAYTLAIAMRLCNPISPHLHVSTQAYSHTYCNCLHRIKEPTVGKNAPLLMVTSLLTVLLMTLTWLGYSQWRKDGQRLLVNTLGLTLPMHMRHGS